MTSKRTKAESDRGKFGVVIIGFETNRPLLAALDTPCSAHTLVSLKKHKPGCLLSDAAFHWLTLLECRPAIGYYGGWICEGLRDERDPQTRGHSVLGRGRI